MLWYAFERTNIGAKIRAAVDNRRMAESVGINVDLLFTLTFALGSGLAALGGGLAIQLFGLTPNFAVLYLVLFLIVVAVGGLGSLKGTLLAALVIGIIDTGGKYACSGRPAIFFIYAITVDRAADQAGGVLWPRVRPRRGARAAKAARERAADYLVRRHYFRWPEALPWLIARRLLLRLSRPHDVRQPGADDGACSRSRST